MAALVTGIVALVFGFIPLLSVLIGAAAIVLGIVALRKNQSRGMSWAGIITGALGALASILVTIAGFIILDEIIPDEAPTPRATVAPPSPETTPSPTATETSTPSPSPTPTPTETPTEPEPSPEPTTEEPTPEPTEDDEAGTVSQQNALDSARNYLSFVAFSKSD